MPKRTDINKVLIIGSGPIIIGQACEFDYSGTQACKALKQLGYEIVLVNSNPATIMTDPETADVTYIEPLNVERLEQIIAKERPDALLPNLGGQSGLNLCAELAKAGVLDKYNVQVIGVQVDAIERGEDRIEFKKSMDAIGIEMARSEVAYSVDDALAIADRLGYPVVLRPAYTMGGAGGGLVYNKEELKTVCARGLQASLVGQVLVEESILGWEELELEVVRDSENNMITVCFIENIDPLGVHTGDSFCSAPMLTISEECQKRLQEQAYRIVESVQVIGGTNVQFAHDPATDRIVVIEINPRTSRSSALASKATGFPIALVSSMLAAGLTLRDIPCGKYGTLDKYVPDGDYVVIKFARWAFEKFKGVEDKLGTQMRAVGEVMSIGKTYKEAFQKAIRSLETGRYGLGHAKDYGEKTKEQLLKMLITPSSDRHFIMYEALRKGASVQEIYDITKVKAWFIEQMKELVEEEEALIASKGSLPSDSQLISAKKNGFSDKYLSQVLDIPEDDIRSRRISLGVEEAWEGVHVSGTENNAYYYSTYNAEDKNPVSTDKPKIMILGGGPHRIGQGGHLPHPLGHGGDPLLRQGQTVQHHLADLSPGRLQVQGVGGENGGPLGPEAVRHSQQGGVPPLPLRAAQRGPGPAGRPQNVHCRHSMGLLPCAFAPSIKPHGPGGRPIGCKAHPHLLLRALLAGQGRQGVLRKVAPLRGLRVGDKVPAHGLAEEEELHHPVGVGGLVVLIPVLNRDEGPDRRVHPRLLLQLLYRVVRRGQVVLAPAPGDGPPPVPLPDQEDPPVLKHRPPGVHLGGLVAHVAAEEVRHLLR